MKLIFSVILLLVSSPLFSQEQLTVFYFGASDCGPCNRPEVISSINQINAEFDSLHQNINVKLVMVTIDNDREEAIKYINKYDSWDEFSMGSRYNNEHTISYLNQMEIPGLPHIVIYKDLLADSDYGTKSIQSREFVKNIMGGVDIVKWVNSGMKID